MMAWRDVRGGLGRAAKQAKKILDSVQVDGVGWERKGKGEEKAEERTDSRHYDSGVARFGVRWSGIPNAHT